MTASATVSAVANASANAAAAAVTDELLSDSSIYPSTDPSIDICKLQCSSMHVRRGSRSDNPKFKSKCKARVVYRIFTEDGQVLDKCNHHFNQYFESHDVAPEMVMRLSDDEEDFLPAARRGRRKRKTNGGSRISKSFCQRTLTVELSAQS